MIDTLHALKWYLSPPGMGPVDDASDPKVHAFLIPSGSFQSISDPQRLAFLEEKISQQKDLERQCAQKLIACAPGSLALIPAIEEDATALLESGQLWGATHQVVAGAPSSCHSNSCYLFEANQDKDIYVATGYALSEDGLWRQHSWCVLKGPRSVKMIETTVPRVAYFGIVLDHQKLAAFADNNTDLGIEIKATTLERFEGAYTVGEKILKRALKVKKPKVL